MVGDLQAALILWGKCHINQTQLLFSQDLEILAFDVKILGPAGSGCLPMWVSPLPMPHPPQPLLPATCHLIAQNWDL